MNAVRADVSAAIQFGGRNASRSAAAPRKPIAGAAQHPIVVRRERALPKGPVIEGEADIRDRVRWERRLDPRDRRRETIVRIEVLVPSVHEPPRVPAPQPRPLQETLRECVRVRRRLRGWEPVIEVGQEGAGPEVRVREQTVRDAGMRPEVRGLCGWEEREERQRRDEEGEGAHRVGNVGPPLTLSSETITFTYPLAFLLDGETVASSGKKVEAKTVEELPGVGPATAEKLREAGDTDMMALAVASPGDLAEVAEIGDAVAKKIIAAAREAADVGGFETGDVILERRKSDA